MMVDGLTGGWFDTQRTRQGVPIMGPILTVVKRKEKR